MEQKRTPKLDLTFADVAENFFRDLLDDEVLCSNPEEVYREDGSLKTYPSNPCCLEMDAFEDLLMTPVNNEIRSDLSGLQLGTLC